MEIATLVSYNAGMAGSPWKMAAVMLKQLKMKGFKSETLASNVFLEKCDSGRKFLMQGGWTQRSHDKPIVFFWVILHVDSKKRDGIWWESTVLLVKRVGRHKRFADLLSGNFENPVLTHFGKSSSKSFWCHCSTNLFSADHREPSSIQSHSSKNTLKPTNLQSQSSAKKATSLPYQPCQLGLYGNPRTSFLTIPTSAQWPAETATGVAPCNSLRNSAEIVCPLQWSRQVQ